MVTTRSKTKKSLSAPKAGQNPLGAGFTLTTQVFGAGLAYALRHFKVEAMLQDAAPDFFTIDADTARYCILGSFALCVGILAAYVNAARAEFDVPWPHLMLPRGDKNAVEYNAVQRAHANFCEAGLVIVPISLVTAQLSPAIIFVSSQAWCWGKFAMSCSYAFDRDTDRRFTLFAWSYLFYFVVHGYVWLGVLSKFGIV